MAHTAFPEAPISYDEPAPTDEELEALYEAFERSLNHRNAHITTDQEAAPDSTGPGNLIDASERFTKVADGAGDHAGASATTQRDPIQLRSVGTAALAGNRSEQDPAGVADNRTTAELDRVDLLRGTTEARSITNHGVFSADLTDVAHSDTPLAVLWGVPRPSDQDIGHQDIVSAGENYFRSEEESDRGQESDTVPQFMSGADLVDQHMRAGAPMLNTRLGHSALSQPFDAPEPYEAPVPRQRQLSAAERAELQEENESILLNLMSQLENEWRSLNSPDSRIHPEDRRRELITFSRNLTGLGRGEMTNILETGTWENLRHDVVAMLHTEERYTEADRLIQSQLGVTLDEFMALGMKVMEGDFYMNQRYAAGMSIRTALFSYLNWYGFRLPIHAPLTDNFTQMFGDPDRWRQQLMGHPVRRTFVGVDWKQVGSDLSNQAQQAFAQAREWWSRLREGAASLLSSGAGDEEVQQAAYVQSQPRSASSSSRTPAPQAQGLRPQQSGEWPAQVERQNHAENTGPRELTQHELDTLTAEQLTEMGIDLAQVPHATQERLAKDAAEAADRRDDEFLN